MEEREEGKEREERGEVQDRKYKKILGRNTEVTEEARRARRNRCEGCLWSSKLSFSFFLRDLCVSVRSVLNL
jgi:hypothetical protein